MHHSQRLRFHQPAQKEMSEETVVSQDHTLREFIREEPNTKRVATLHD